jgi:DNA-binding XRE family transcriptional regulator
MDTITLKNKKYVLVPEAEYRKLIREKVALPPVDADGNRPALAFADAAIAQTLVKRREAAGLTQKELALRAGIRPEVLNRAERGTTIPSVRTLTKIDKVLSARETRRRALR